MHTNLKKRWNICQICKLTTIAKSTAKPKHHKWFVVCKKCTGIIISCTVPDMTISGQLYVKINLNINNYRVNYVLSPRYTQQNCTMQKRTSIFLPKCSLTLLAKTMNILVCLVYSFHLKSLKFVVFPHSLVFKNLIGQSPYFYLLFSKIIVFM